ncbi:MAG: hypothetical protein R3308_11005, partial [Thiohalobacterales bacterium]|nr:hypothetical protein [Thiohalobacterales bacterium]
MLNQLPILPVLLPLIGAPACWMLRSPRSAWVFASLVALLAFAAACLLLAQTWSEGPLSYYLGGWDAPWGIEYRIDLLNATIMALVSGMGCVVLLGGRASIWS